MSKLSSFLLFLTIFFLSIILIIPFVIINGDPKTGDFLVYLITGIFAVEFVVYFIVFGLIKMVIGILERK